MDPLWLLLIGMGTVIGGILVLRLHAFFALVLAALVVGALTPRAALEQFAQDRKMSPGAAKQFVEQPLGKRVAKEFGNTCGNIGIIIALAAVIGKCLLDSGGADRIVRFALRCVGEARAGWAFLLSGFTLAIPVFFDTVFYLLIPLAKALRVRTGRNYLLYVIAITAGGTMAHSLVPPTPGPLLVADQLGVHLGYMMIGGLVVGAVTSIAGYAYAVWINRRLDVPLRDTADAVLDDLTAITQRDDRELPRLGFALLPIVLPVVLISADAILKVAAGPNASATFTELLKYTSLLGDPNIALALAALAALALVVRPRRAPAKPWSASLQDALSSGGLIILITAAGGAFGAILQQTGVGHRIGALAETHQLGVLPLAWLVAALVRSAQGSATVAMITAVGVVASFIQPTELAFHPVYVALAIGCGSKLFPWMNDSGFWIVNRMSGMTVGETVKTFSFQLCIMGVVGLAAVVLLAKLFPLI